jgi:hypothetical protein
VNINFTLHESLKKVVLDLFLSINVLYYVMFHVLCGTPGRVATAFSTANEDPYEMENTKLPVHQLWKIVELCLYTH